MFGVDRPDIIQTRLHSQRFKLVMKLRIHKIRFDAIKGAIQKEADKTTLLILWFSNALHK